MYSPALTYVDMCYYENGDKYEGSWSNDKRDGKGWF